MTHKGRGRAPLMTSEYRDVGQRAIRQPTEMQEREDLSRWLDDHPVTITQFKHPDQRLESRGVQEGHT